LWVHDATASRQHRIQRQAEICINFVFQRLTFPELCSTVNPKKVDGRVRLDTENNFEKKSKKIVRVVAEIFSVTNQLLVGGSSLFRLQNDPRNPSHLHEVAQVLIIFLSTYSGVRG